MGEALCCLPACCRPAEEEQVEEEAAEDLTFNRPEVSEQWPYVKIPANFLKSRWGEKNNTKNMAAVLREEKKENPEQGGKKSLPAAFLLSQHSPFSPFPLYFTPLQ